jgi:hypothetical protein
VRSGAILVRRLAYVLFFNQPLVGWPVLLAIFPVLHGSHPHLPSLRDPP